jgi:serine/threonine-protein kinase
MGIVYAAEHLTLGVTRALKVLTVEAARDPIFRARFERESRLAASLEHPNIVPVFEAGETEGRVFLSMRYVDGPTLREVLSTRGALPLAEVADLVAQVAAALDAAHASGLVHRDVKPANILLENPGEKGRIFLGDFGISRLLVSARDLTETGEMLGTVNYVAPEQIAGASVDARSDVYSLGCVAFEALAGRPPFERETQLATMFAHANDPRPSATAMRNELPAAVDRVFARALAIEPLDRYAHAYDFADDLGRALAGERVRARRRLAMPTRARAAIAVSVLLIAAVLGALAIAGAFSGSGGGGPPAAPAARAIGNVDVASHPVAVAVGQFNVFTASTSEKSVSALVPAASHRARPPIATGGAPVSLVAAFSSIWVVDRAGNRLLRVSPGQGSPPVPIPVGKKPSDVAVSSTYLWVTNEGDDTLSRVDPNTNRVKSTSPVGDAPRSVAVGEGGVWVADSGDGTLTELDPATGKPRGTPVHVDGAPDSLAVGEAGVWVIDSMQGRLVRVSPGSGEVSPPIVAGPHPTSVTTGFGYAWVAYGDNTVRRIDPTQLLAAGDPIPVGRSPDSIAAGDGYVWTANRGDSTVTRIQPNP